MWSLQCPFNPDHGYSVHALLQVGEKHTLLSTHSHCSCPEDAVLDFWSRQDEADLVSRPISKLIVLPNEFFPERRN